MKSELNVRLFDEAKNLVAIDEPLGRHTTYDIGGPARFFASPENTDEVRLLVEKARRAELPMYILGGGSNLLISDSGLAGLVLHMNRMRGIEVKNGKLHVGAGGSLPGLVKRTARMGIKGFGRFAGIPGLVGGMIRTNSGGRHGTLADVLHSVVLISHNGEEVVRNAEDFNFGHRRSNLSDEIAVKLIFNVESGDPAELNAERRKIMKLKTASQPLSDRNAGCCFSNPAQGIHASKLIDECGLKGFGVGGAVVSEEHANFICNEDDATADEVRKLMGIVRDTVLSETGFELKQEIIYWS
ncbi:MAG: UDP-N-acetylmuramate dehydrogenase [Planctomycetota bacterium]|jgi:UDP-N-acetylmuramate dehydrogenase|nr:UDP-N-acetylmuramate dehydrogenase [Planctomycetota bacterium]